MNTSSEEQQFTSLNMPEEKGIQSGGLDFLPSNYDYDSPDQTNNSSYTKNSDSDSVINLTGNYSINCRVIGTIISYRC